LAAVAFDTSLEFEARLRRGARQAAVGTGTGPVEERESAASDTIERWELHSELVLVCPEVCNRARELLPERDPDGFLARARESTSTRADNIDRSHQSTSLPVAVLGYAVWRLAETARSAAIAVGAVVAFALLAQLLH
jgi:hypothetical protein